MLTNSQHWSAPQRRMMSQAGRLHAIRSGIVAATLIAAALIGLKIRGAVVERQNATRAEGQVDALMRADIAQVPGIIDHLSAYRTWADPLLKANLEQAPAGSGERLNLSLALLGVDQEQIKYLRDQLLVVTPQQFPIVRDALLACATGKRSLPVAAPGNVDPAPATLQPWWVSDVVEPLWQTALDIKGETKRASKPPVPWPLTTLKAKTGRAFKALWLTIWSPSPRSTWPNG